MKDTRPARNRDSRAARRAVLPGYPLEPRKFSFDEIKAYFSGDCIVCLRCGKKYKRLGTHLGRIHAISEDEYRDMYGLPWTRGLTCDESHKRYIDAMKRRFAAGYSIPDNSALGPAAIRANGMRNQPFRAEQRILNLRQSTSSPERKF